MKTRISFLFRGVACLMAAALFTACSSDRPVVNLALFHPAYHSGSIDYNVTAQLAVDGIVETEPACWVEVCGNDGIPLSKREHDLPIEPREWTSVTVDGSKAELSLRTHGFTEPVDRITMTLVAHFPQGVWNAPYSACLYCLDAEGRWTAIKEFKGRYTDWQLSCEWKAPKPVAPEGWRFVIDAPGAESIEWQSWCFYCDGGRKQMLTSQHFHSAWVSPTGGREWMTVDLGEVRKFSEVRLNWLNAPAKGVLQVGKDSTSWRDIAVLDGTEPVRCDTLKVSGRGRWVRVLLDESVDGKPYVLTEMEVMGPAPEKAATEQPENPVDGSQINLRSGWELARLHQAADPAAWIPATVPGTVLVSYLDNGILPDPNFSDNQLYISDSYFNTPFIYRTRFTLPEDWRTSAADEHIRLQFDGINWLADVDLNGKGLGRIEGAFTDASFDITPLLQDENLLEVTVYPPAHPGATKENTQERCATNGGILGGDNPTFHASIGWDWIPTIRGRNMGIWNDVRLERSGPVRILDPKVSFAFNTLESLPPIIDTSLVRITLDATLVNDAEHPVETVWEGTYGEVPFSVPVTLPAGGSLPVSTKVELEHPQLWWPNGYGEPHLYTVTMKAGDSQTLSFESGVRQLTYDLTPDNLRIWINGRRLVGRGGNWGFSESNLRSPGAGSYDIAMQMHRHENFNLVRNWVGMVGDREFYEAADRNGILVWQDFWLANPADGPDPYDEELFMANAENMMRRIRNHPCLLLWCGRNEGYPPQTLDKALRALVARDNPESIFISSSADDVVSGHGPYYRLPSKDYWQLDQVPSYRYETVQFHSERGMPNFPNWESLVQMMRPSEAWPPSRMWGIHDFALESAQRGQTFIDAVESFFGPSPDGETFAARAQWVNYEGYRSMFESRSKNRRGLLLWMSHPAWPSMAFCTYDWFGDATASYYACRKACEPIHIQWNPVAECAEVVNYSAGDRTGLRLDAQLTDMHGIVLGIHSCTLDAPEDSTVPCFDTPVLHVADSLPEVSILRLRLYEGDNILSQNDYILPTEQDNLKALNNLPKATVEVKAQLNRVVVTNTSDTPALMLHLVARRKDGSRILPALWSDNYIHLMPGESRELEYRIPDGETFVKIETTGFNVGR